MSRLTGLLRTASAAAVLTCAVALAAPGTASAHAVSCWSYVSLTTDSRYVYVNQVGGCNTRPYALTLQSALVVEDGWRALPFYDGAQCGSAQTCHYTWRIRDAAGRQRYCASSVSKSKAHWYSWTSTGPSSGRRCTYA